MIGRDSRNNRGALIVMEDMLGQTVRRPYLDRIRRLPNTVFPDNREYRPVGGDSWASIASRFYGNSYLWWVVAEFNRVVDPFTELQQAIESGRTLVIPSLTRVQFDVLSFDDSRLRK